MTDELTAIDAHDHAFSDDFKAGDFDVARPGEPPVDELTVVNE